MKKKNLISLFLAAGVVLLAAFVVTMGRNRASARTEPTSDFPGIADRVNDVNEIEITDNANKSTVKRVEGEWTLVERDGYPALAENVKDAVVRLSRLEVIEPKTDRPENFARLGLQDPDTEGSHSKRITLRDGEGAEIAAFIVGDTKYAGRKPTIFMRAAGENQTYQCRGRLNVRADPMSWIDRQVIKLENGKVKTLEIEHADGEHVLIEREPGSTDYAVQNVPEGKKPSFKGSANSPATALSYVRLDDVRPLDQVDFDEDPVAKATYTQDDGLVVSVELAHFEGHTWACFGASFVEPEKSTSDTTTSDTTTPDTTTPEEGTPEKGAADAIPSPDEGSEHAKVEARSLQRSFDRWAYQLPDFKAETIAKRSADLLVDIAPENADAPQTTDEQ